MRLPHLATAEVVQEERPKVAMKVFVMSDFVEMTREALDELLAVAAGIIDAQHLEKMSRGREPLEGGQGNFRVQSKSDVIVNMVVTVSTIERVTLEVRNLFFGEMI